MDGEIFQINENTWRIENGMVRIFLLAGTEKALLVDTGMTLRGVKELAERLTGLPVELINTHGDPDHVGANDDFDRVYLHPDETPNYRHSGMKNEIVPVREGDVIELGGRPIEIIHLPGHTPGSIGLLDRNAGVLLGGDTVQTGSIVMLGPNRSIAVFAESLEKLKTGWTGRFDTVWGSHGKFPLPASVVPELLESARHVMAGEGTAEPCEFFGHPVVRYRWGCGSFLMED